MTPQTGPDGSRRSRLGEGRNEFLAVWYQTARGENCREFETTVTIDGRDQRTTSRICRQPDGTWKIVQERAASPIDTNSFRRETSACTPLTLDK